MASPVSFKIEGLAELERKLREFGPKVEEAGLRSSTYAGAKVIAKAAQGTAPVRTGLLAASIYPSRRKAPPFTAKYSVKVRKVKVTLVGRSRKSGKFHKVSGPERYGRFVEFGTSKMAAKPFLRPAFYNNVGGAIQAIRQGMARAVKRAAAKS